MKISANEFNRLYPVGTRVLYRPPAHRKDTAPVATVTTTAAWLNSIQEVVVRIEGSVTFSVPVEQIAPFYFQNPRDRIAILSLFRAAGLADHMGDMWNDLIIFAELAGIEIPWDEDDDADLHRLEEMGAAELRELRKLLQRPQEPRG